MLLVTIKIDDIINYQNKIKKKYVYYRVNINNEIIFNNKKTSLYTINIKYKIQSSCYIK